MYKPLLGPERKSIFPFFSTITTELQYSWYRQGRIQEFKTGGRGSGAVEFLVLRFALMPLHTYLMFLLEE